MLLITGASGNVGTAIYNLAVLKGMAAIGTSFSHKKAGLYNIDLASKELCEEFFNKYSFKTVIHCSAHIGRGIETYWSNISQAVNIARFSRSNFMVNISSAGIYNVNNNLCLDESAEKKKDDYYVISKKHCEEIFVKRFSDEHLLNLRISSPYSVERFSASVLYTMIKSAHANGRIELWGSGERTQSFTNVEKLAEDIFSLVEGRVSGTYNYNTSGSLSMNQLAMLIKNTFSEFGKNVRVDLGERPDPEDDCRACIDCSKIKKIIEIKNTFYEDIKKIIRSVLSDDRRSI